MSTSNLVDNTDSAPNATNIVQGFHEEANPELKLPEKFQGKAKEEIVKSYLELESQLGKQGQELGELRRVTDAYIKSQLEKDLAANSPMQNKNESTYDLSTLGLDLDEETASRVKTLLEKELSPVKAELTDLKKEKFLTKIGSKHSDFQEIVQDKEFQNWVMESPVRIELYKRGDLGYDYASADELFSIWKTKKGAPAEIEKAVEAAAMRNEAFQKGQMETGNSMDKPAEKRYRRIDIIELKRTDPDRYRALEPEIMRAYAEKRVY